MPDTAALSASLDRLAAYPKPVDIIPEPGSDAEWDIFTAASIVFLNPAQADRARAALRAALGGMALELLTAYLAFIRMAHYWTQTHPDLAYEEDMDLLMRQHEELGRMLLDPSDSERSKVGARLFDELETLRGERDDRIALREALDLNQKAQRHQQLLIHELNHRVKNTLAIIQSIAMQTLRGHDTPREVQEAFLSRLMALADAHDILTAENWDSAELGHVLTHAVGMHQPIDGPAHITLAGPMIRLEPKAAVAVAMATHELATNAAKYGALSSVAGSIAIKWTIEESPEGPMLKLTWTEHGGPLVVAPARRGFGSRLIERGLAGELNGSAQLDFRPEGMVCTIEAPLPVVGAVE